MISLWLTLLVTILTMIDHEDVQIKHLRIGAALASCLLIIKIYDWLRLFEKTAFFIKLVEVMLKDIKWFTVLFFVALLMFGVPIWLIDCLVNQYVLAIGEF